MFDGLGVVLPFIDIQTRPRRARIEDDTVPPCTNELLQSECRFFKQIDYTKPSLLCRTYISSPLVAADAVRLRD